MRRSAAILLVIIVMIGLCTTVSASTAVSMEYVPRAKNGTVFYLDVYSEAEIGAGVFELSFDGDAVEYRSIAGYDGASVQAAENDGLLRIAYGHPSGGSGCLLRLTFNALVSTETDFTLHVSEAVDGDIATITDIGDYCLSADVGKHVTLSAGTASSHSKAGKGGSSKTEAPSESTKSSAAKEDDDEVKEVVVIKESGERALSNREPIRWILVGGCSVIILTAVIAAAYFYGKRKGSKAKALPVEDEAIEDNSNKEQ